MSTILITGASRGIGLATALVLARAGHAVYATMRNPTGSPQLARAAEGERLQIEISAMDVDSDASVAGAIREIERKVGAIDVLVNNAGVEARGSIEELDLGICRAVMETNYFGTLRCIRAVLPEMRRRKRGRIINITSVAGKIAASPLGAYSASKSAVEAISEALAQELRPFNIQVTVVQPGITDTAMARRIGEPAQPSAYPHARRMAGLFSAALQSPTSPEVIAEKIRDIVASDTWQFRHPVGPDAAPFLAWRAAMTDEQWVDWNAAEDATWFQSVDRDFGLNARPGARVSNGTS